MLHTLYTQEDWPCSRDTHEVWTSCDQFLKPPRGAVVLAGTALQRKGYTSLSLEELVQVGSHQLSGANTPLGEGAAAR